MKKMDNKDFGKALRLVISKYLITLLDFKEPV